MMEDIGIGIGMTVGLVIAILVACIVIDTNTVEGFNVSKAQVLCPDGIRTLTLMTFTKPKVECNDGTNHKVK